MKHDMHQQALGKQFEFARNNRKVATNEEAMMWKVLRNRKIENQKIRRQHPIGEYILDFYCEAMKIGIEIDGGYHLEKETQENDKIRTEYFTSKGIEILRFTNEEVNQELEKVIAQIKRKLK